VHLQFIHHEFCVFIFFTSSLKYLLGLRPGNSTFFIVVGRLLFTGKNKAIFLYATQQVAIPFVLTATIIQNPAGVIPVNAAERIQQTNLHFS
jgi:hypothetical protein